MISVRQYKPEDYLNITRRQFDMVTFQNWQNPERVARSLCRGRAYTMMNDDEIITCGGVVPFWKGVGEAWLVSSPLVTRFPIAFAKVVHDGLDSIIKKCVFERVQTAIHVDFVVSMKWVERMGFKSEGVMRKYIAGQDYVRYAWIKGG